MAEPRSAEDGYYCADCLIQIPNGPWNLSVCLYLGSTLCALHVRKRVRLTHEAERGQSRG